MPRSLLTAEQFATAVADHAGAPAASIFRLASADPAAVDRQAGRVIPYILSTGAVARDGHTIAPAGWQLTNFRSNPVFLWAHESSEPPIGRLTDVSVANGALRGIVEYADADTYPFADTIFRLVKGGFLNSVSVSWDPIRWSYSTDRSRPGGIDFLEQELREVSQVPVPADVTAIATARASGIDTGPLYEWAERILDSGDTVLIPRGELENLRREAKMPRNSRGTAADPAPGVTADPPAPVVIPPYVPQPRSAMPAAPLVRDLYDVSSLASLISSLSFVQWCMAQEAAWEGDGSPLPDRLLDIIKAAGQLLVESTAEEVGELIESLSGEDGSLRAAPTDALTGAQALRAAVMMIAGRSVAPQAAAARVRNVEGLQIDAMAALLRRGMLNAAGQAVLADMILARAGKTLSASNETALRAAHDHMRAAADGVASVVGQNAPDSALDPLAALDPPTVTQQPDPDDAARQARGRMARAAIAAATVAAAAE
jgi:HK97 family phage prohead protease